MLVFAVAVSHSPAMEIRSSPQESWLKNLGCPGMKDVTRELFVVLTIEVIYNLFTFAIQRGNATSIRGAFPDSALLIERKDPR
jgi:hypothetical protein